MSLLKRFQKFWLVWAWLVTVFLLSGLILNCVQILILPLWYISRNVFRRINADCYVTHTGQVSAYFLLLIYSVGVAAIHSSGSVLPLCM